MRTLSRVAVLVLTLVVSVRESVAEPPVDARCQARGAGEKATVYRSQRAFPAVAQAQLADAGVVDFRNEALAGPKVCAKCRVLLTTPETTVRCDGTLLVWPPSLQMSCSCQGVAHQNLPIPPLPPGLPPGAYTTLFRVPADAGVVELEQPGVRNDCPPCGAVP